MGGVDNSYDHVSRREHDMYGPPEDTVGVIGLI